MVQQRQVPNVPNARVRRRARTTATHRSQAGCDPSVPAVETQRHLALAWTAAELDILQPLWLFHGIFVAPKPSRTF